MMLIPYRADVPMARMPVANFVIIGITVLISISLFGSATPSRSFVLGVGTVSGWVGHLVCHGDVIHLLGNMIFLWVFGNAVCAKLTNRYYAPLYVLLGLSAAATHVFFDGDPAIGASGAVNGVVGLFLVFYPLNQITCFYLIFLRPGTFSVSSVWMIVLWLLFDIWGAASGGGNIAYWAHLGGFFMGVGIGVVVLCLGWIEMSRGERSLLAVLKLREDGLARRLPDAEESEQASESRPRSAMPVGVAGSPVLMTVVPARVRVPCTGCPKRLRVPLKYVGKRVRCPACQTVLAVPVE